MITKRKLMAIFHEDKTHTTDTDHEMENCFQLFNWLQLQPEFYSQPNEV